MSSQTVSVVDFFSGCGGTSQGLQDAGMTILAGVDNNLDAASTFRDNFPKAHFFERNVLDLASSEVAKILPESGPVLFAGCAPCQPFSAQKKDKGVGDPRRLLLLEFLRFIEDLSPEFVMVENVPGLQTLDANAGPFRLFVERLSQAGYSVDYGVLRAVDFGVPQIRRRLVLLASRVSDIKLPVPTHGAGLIPQSTVADWISALPELAAGETSAEDPDHSCMQLSELNLKRIRATKEGGGRMDWTDELKLSCHSNYSGHTDVYGRLSWAKPASGLTTKCISYSNGRFGHPTQDRALSVREAALLQTFPATFRLSGTLTSRARQIGNAVPPLMARRAGEAILASMRSLSGASSPQDPPSW